MEPLVQATRTEHLLVKKNGRNFRSPGQNPRNNQESNQQESPGRTVPRNQAWPAGGHFVHGPTPLARKGLTS
jgi:hypothetical protein